MTNTCGGCDATWTGTRVAHCGGCHQTFAYFDKERVMLRWKPMASS